MQRVYKLSGRVEPAGLLMVLILGTVLCGALGFAYGVGYNSVPWAKLRMVVTLLVGFAAGGIIGGLAIKGRMRNQGLAALAGLIGAVVLVYTAWVGWLYQLFEYEDSPVWNPATIFTLAKRIQVDGTWSYGNDVFSGMKLIAVWITEIALLSLPTLIIPYFMLRGRVYCEHCQKWVADKVSSDPLAVAPVNEMKVRLDNRDWSALTQWPGEPYPETAPYLRADMLHCARCNRVHVLNIMQVPAPAKNAQRTEVALISGILADTDAMSALQKRVPAVAAAEPVMDAAPSA